MGLDNKFKIDQEVWVKLKVKKIGLKGENLEYIKLFNRKSIKS